jgi:cell division protein FtsA
MTTNPLYVAGLDAGGRYTRCVIGLVEDGRLRYLGHGQVHSAGWSRDRLSDPTALTVCIAAAVREAEKKAGVPVEGMVVGVGGAGVEGFDNTGRYEFSHPRPVGREQMKFALDKAANVRLEDDRCLLQICPQDFTVDGRAGCQNPNGSTCTRLEANVHVITAWKHEHTALVNSVHQAHYAVEETAYEPLAAAYAAILAEDRTRGVALVDIGCDSTDIVVYEGESLVLAKSLPISADHFTRDVAWVLKVSYDDAERIKREYGCAILGLTADNSLIEVPSPEGRGPREAPRRVLNEVLEARAEELFHFVKEALASVAMEQNLLEGVVLTGGGSLLTGMCDMAERVLNVPARLGLAIGMENWPEETNNAAWTVAAGLCMYSARLKLKREWKRKAPGLIGLVLR